MILEDILNKLTWSPYGIQCPDIYTAKLVHKFMREAVLDRHIYISKVIGFAVKTNNTFRPFAGTYIARHKQIGESYPEVMVNLLDKVFLNTSKTQLDTILSVGSNTTLNCNFDDGEGNIVDVLSTKPDICRCLDKQTVFRVKLQYDCGFRDMARNTKDLKPEFFPCYTDFSLADYVRILPMQPGTVLVPIRYYNGMTEEKFKDILGKWLLYIQTKSLKGEESLWLQSFMH